MFAIVRDAGKATHLAAATQGLENVHVLEADVIDFRSLEVLRQVPETYTSIR